MRVHMKNTIMDEIADVLVKPLVSIPLPMSAPPDFGVWAILTDKITVPTIKNMKTDKEQTKKYVEFPVGPYTRDPMKSGQAMKRATSSTETTIILSKK